MDGGVSAVGFVAPIDDRFKRFILLADLEPHESVSKGDIFRDLAGGMNEEIARGQVIEVGLNFFLADRGRQKAFCRFNSSSLCFSSARLTSMPPCKCSMVLRWSIWSNESLKPFHSSALVPGNRRTCATSASPGSRGIESARRNSE